MWIVGWHPGESTADVPRRFGEVVDVTGLSFDDAVATIVSYRPDGVAVVSDAAIRIAAAVAEQLDLPFNSVATAGLLSDKVAQREALRTAGVAVPRFAAVRYGQSIKDVPYPAVLKPRAGAGSRDTSEVNSNEDVVRLLASCNPEEEFILEKWLSDSTNHREFAADLVSVETVVAAGRNATRDGDRSIPLRPTVSRNRVIRASDLSDDDKDAVRDVATSAIRALDITSGVVHTEVKMTRDGARLVEVNGRVGGSISPMISKIGGPSMMRLVLQLAVGADVGKIPSIEAKTIAFYRLLVGPVGATRVVAIDHLDDVATIPGVEQVSMNKRIGDEISARHSAFTDCTVRVDGVVNSYPELLDVMIRIDATLELSFG